MWVSAMSWVATATAASSLYAEGRREAHRSTSDGPAPGQAAAAWPGAGTLLSADAPSRQAAAYGGPRRRGPLHLPHGLRKQVHAAAVLAREYDRASHAARRGFRTRGSDLIGPFRFAGVWGTGLTRRQGAHPEYP